MQELSLAGVYVKLLTVSCMVMLQTFASVNSHIFSSSSSSSVTFSCELSTRSAQLGENLLLSMYETVENKSSNTT